MTAAVRSSSARAGDAAVIERSVREPEHFAELFDRYHTEVHGYLARRLDRNLADDLASETFLIAFSRRGQYDLGFASARPWLYGIASNLVARHHRAEQRRYRALARAGADEIGESHAERADVRLDAQARRGHLAAALAGIADADRDVLLLMAWADLTSEEAGRALGSPPERPGPGCTGPADQLPGHRHDSPRSCWRSCSTAPPRSTSTPSAPCTCAG